MCETLDNAIKYGLDFINKGNTASYIPQLSKVDPHQLGISILQSDGSGLSSGDYDRKFTIQSISKTVALMLALMDRGQDYVFDKVGMEPTGDAFNSIIKLEIKQPSIPLNPMISAGAIAIDSLIEGNDINHKFNRLICFFRKICHNDSLWYNEKVYLSEKATGFRNWALANFIKDSGELEGEVEEVLDLYVKQCSIEIDCRDIVMLGAVLAMDGISPITGKTLIPKNICRIVKTLMVTCGMYDASGEFSIKVGIPAKRVTYQKN
ncbi:glutaminase A [Clostridium estertheticum]|uniref:glutaminase A n=1 Tax=Clostridium estertheticum TaxID=238834 RepID=UPI001C0B3A3D|nr:glutaminase A [Clostridium estertheticum]MBU3187426.1 glutaminase A [Clostridium estertheticum]